MLPCLLPPLRGAEPVLRVLLNLDHLLHLLGQAGGQFQAGDACKVLRSVLVCTRVSNISLIKKHFWLTVNVVYEHKLSSDLRVSFSMALTLTTVNGDIKTSLPHIFSSQPEIKNQLAHSRLSFWV